MKLFKFTLPLAFLCVAASSATAQNWIQEFEGAVNVDPSVAVSDAGQVAVIKPKVNQQVAISVMAADGSLQHSFGVEAMGSPGTVSMNDALFLDESTLVLCGSVNNEPYMAAYDIQTGNAVWEKSLTAEGSMVGMTRNSIGHIIAHGTLTENGIDETLLCAVNAQGGFHWFRSYNPGPGANYSQEVVGIPGGDLYLVLRFDGRLMVMRLTDWGHEVWSEEITLTNRTVEKARATLASDGDLLIGLVLSDGMTTKNGALRMEADSDVLWAKQYTLPNLGGAPADLRSVASTSGNGLWMGIKMKNPHLVALDSAGISKVGVTGNLISNRHYGTHQFDNAPDVVAMPDGSGLAAAFKRNFQGMRVLRAGQSGAVGPCSINNAVGSTANVGIQSVQVTYTYENFPGGIGTQQTTVIAESEPVLNVCRQDGTIGKPFCEGDNVNSTGQQTLLTAVYGTGMGANLRLEGKQGPPNQFGYFLVGTHKDSVGTSISHGRLCLGNGVEQVIGRYNVNGTPMNSIGKFDGMGDLQNLAGTSSTGMGFNLPSQVPTVGGNITYGQTLHFQLWHREDFGESNFSNGLTITF